MNDRRRLLLRLAALAAVPLAARAQDRPKMLRVGGLMTVPAAALSGQWEAFRQSLRDLGYAEGRNLVVEFHSAEGRTDRIDVVAAALVASKVDLIVAGGTEAVQAARKATATIPIVMATIGDPVGAGVVSNLARPGGNVTGMSLLATGISAKWLELLRDTVPKLSRLTVLWNSNNSSVVLKVRELEKASAASGMNLQAVEVRSADQFEPAINGAERAHAQALILTGDALQQTHRAQIMKLANQRMLPTIGEFSSFAEAGALLSYGPNTIDLYRRAAVYVDRIVKGSRPGELPIEQPTQFDLVVNQKTARVLGLTVPQAILLRATKLIE